MISFSFRPMILVSALIYRTNLETLPSMLSADLPIPDIFIQEKLVPHLRAGFAQI